MSEKDPTTSASFLVSAVFLGVVLIGALVVVFWPDNEDQAGAPPHEEPEPSTSAQDETDEGIQEDPLDLSSFTPSASGSLCGLEPHETEFDALLPEPTTTWNMINGMQVPTSPVHGPGVAEDEESARFCYSRTPEGAVLATSNFLVLANVGQERMAGQWERLVAPGPGRDLFIEDIESQEPTTEVAGQLSAAKVITYTEDQARVSLGLIATDGLRMSMTFDLVWAEGDWKIVVDEQGGGDPNFTLLDSFAGFTPWAAI